MHGHDGHPAQARRRVFDRALDLGIAEQLGDGCLAGQLVSHGKVIVTLHTVAPVGLFTIQYAFHLQALDRPYGLHPVNHQVAQAPDLINCRLELVFMPQHGLQGINIGMDIGKNRIARVIRSSSLSDRRPTFNWYVECVDIQEIGHPNYSGYRIKISNHHMLSAVISGGTISVTRTDMARMKRVYAEIGGAWSGIGIGQPSHLAHPLGGCQSRPNGGGGRTGRRQHRRGSYGRR